jgi:hypothetical protein
MLRKLKKTAKKVWYIYRDSKTGKFVTQLFAHYNPATTEKEKIK